MLNELSIIPTPEWLIEIARDPERADFSLENILADSLYYPACGLNGTPVKFLAGNVLSFVYADYGVTKEEYLQNLNGRDEECGFCGYHSILQREIFRYNIVPNNWHPPIRPTGQENINRLLEQEKRCRPFGHWSIWQRNHDKDDTHGPELFSFLYLGGEMSAIYQGLYCRLEIASMILAIIQPGGGLGGGWEPIEDDSSFFKRVVASNQAGMPEYILYGGNGGPDFYKEPCWSEYQGERIVQLRERYAGLWRLSAHRTTTRC